MHAQGGEVKAFLSGQERKLNGVLPRELTVRERLGYVELDLTQATFKPGVTTIEARSFMGYVQIRLPAGVRVDSARHALFGFFSLKGKSDDPPRGVRLVGPPVFGFLQTRNPRKPHVPSLARVSHKR